MSDGSSAGKLPSGSGMSTQPTQQFNPQQAGAALGKGGMQGGMQGGANPMQHPGMDGRGPGQFQHPGMGQYGQQGFGHGQGPLFPGQGDMQPKLPGQSPLSTIAGLGGAPVNGAGGMAMNPAIFAQLQQAQQLQGQGQNVTGLPPPAEFGTPINGGAGGPPGGMRNPPALGLPPGGPLPQGANLGFMPLPTPGYAQPYTGGAAPGYYSSSVGGQQPAGLSNVTQLPSGVSVQQGGNIPMSFQPGPVPMPAGLASLQKTQ